MVLVPIINCELLGFTSFSQFLPKFSNILVRIGLKMVVTMMSVHFPKIANYQAVELIHQSDRTLVYRGCNTDNGQSVIIKLMRNQYPSFNELVQFRNQYVIAKNLEIEGIVKPHVLEHYGNHYALIMEDMGDVSLAEYQRTLSFSLLQFFDLAIQLTEILHQLHHNSIIHKDIKPDNILIHPKTQQIKLIDFSISTLLPKETQTIQTPNVLEGTLAYLSPEQTGRMNRGIDYRSDFYSLGVTFYELLAGTLPFTHDDPLELIHAHIAQTPEPIISHPSPVTRHPIPEVLSDLVLKLMAKNAEDRYQSALGLKYDLERCLVRYRETKEIAPFALGERDICDRFNIPEKLYGREKEVQALLDAFERIASPPALLEEGECARAEMMLVAGFSGIGKTAVINEVHKPIVKNRGYFIKGKFDQFNRNIPFSAFVQAFRSLMGQLLGESDADLAHWKAKILEALGESGQVLIEVIPELERVIGQQPGVPELSGSAAQNRFNLLLEKLIAIFTTKEHPLVIFLDDLQWADSASLSLMKVLMGENRTGYLLLLGAYRDNEVFPAHPLMLTLAELGKQEATISTITLSPLSEDYIARLVAETLNCRVETAKPLTQLIYRKTRGNPFFTTQFLKGLQVDGLIAFNHNLGYWQCDLVKVQDAALTDDVVEFMAGRLHKLPEATQEVLKLAACIGNQFDLETLAIICETPSEEVAAALWSALRDGLILPRSEAYKFFQGEVESNSIETKIVSYQFLHDRVQQAAYSLISEDRRSRTHRSIGELLWNNIPCERRDSCLFDIVNHLNLGAMSYVDSDEILFLTYDLAKLNLQAGRKAKSATAYVSAKDYLNLAIQYLLPDCWQSQYMLSRDIYRLLAEVEYLSGDFERSEEIVNLLLERSRSNLEKTDSLSLLIIQLTMQTKYDRAIETGIQALSLLGIDISQTDWNAEFNLEIVKLKNRQNILKTNSKNVKDLPVLTNAKGLATMQVLANMYPLAYMVNRSLFNVLVLKGVNLSVELGYTPESAPTFSWYSLLLGSLLQDYPMSRKIGDFALKIADRFNFPAQKCQAFDIFSNFCSAWVSPLTNTIQLNQEAFQAALDSGEFPFAGYILVHRIFNSFYLGVYLPNVLADVEQYLSFVESIGHHYATDAILGSKLAICNVIGLTQSKSSFDLDMLTESQYLQRFENQNFYALCRYLILKAQLLYFYEEFDSAWEAINNASQKIDFITSTISVAEYYFIRSLILAKRYRTWDEGERAKIATDLELSQKKMSEWSRYAPENFLHKFQLIEAERYRLNGDLINAINFYDRAIAGAKENDYIQEEALANELFAKFYMDWGKEKYAALHMQEAYYCYARWGAKAKTNDLEQRYPQLLRPILQRDRTSCFLSRSISQITGHSQTTTVADISDLLDFSSLLKASQTLSGEIELDRLLSTLMQIILENAGATKGALLLTGEKGLTVEAIATRTDTEKELAFASLHQSILLDDYPDLPAGLINTVRRTTETALLDAKTAQTQFAADNYLLRFSPQSLLCLPLLERGNLIGILYLENTLTADAFTSDRVEILETLCAQAAISLENARLYRQAQQALKDLQKTQLQLVQNEKMAALGNLVAGVAHEINNPIGFIGGNINAALKHLQDLLDGLSVYRENASISDEMAEQLENLDLEFIAEDFPKLIASMQTGCDRIRQIGTSLRTFSRTDTDKKTEFNLHEGLDSTLLILKYRLKANEERPAIEIVKNYGEIPQVKCYPGQLNQVFMNLLANAIDALDESNVGFSYQDIEKNPNRIHIKTERDKERIIVKISDNGKGMSERVKARIFEQGFTTKGVGKGTGLGMAIAKAIVEEKHGGAIACLSELGKGTEFIISLPLD